MNGNVFVRWLTDYANWWDRLGASLHKPIWIGGEHVVRILDANPWTMVFGFLLMWLVILGPALVVLTFFPIYATLLGKGLDLGKVTYGQFFGSLNQFWFSACMAVGADVSLVSFIINKGVFSWTELGTGLVAGLGTYVAFGWIVSMEARAAFLGTVVGGSILFLFIL